MVFGVEHYVQLMYFSNADPLRSESALPTKGHKSDVPQVNNDDVNVAQGPPRPGSGGGDKEDEDGSWVSESNTGIAQLVTDLFALLIGGL